jgi:HAD superfamily hydrolase (TIGR01509 family)
MKSPYIQAILFDLDGTIIDTEPAAVASVKTAFQEWNIQITPEDASFVTGRTWENAFDFLFQKYNLPIPQTAAKEIILNHYQQEVEKNLFVVPGSVAAVELFSTLFPLGLVSGSHRKQILWALQKLKIKEKFKIILGAEDYPQSKPKPDGYLKAIQTLNIPPHRCLVFEDSTAGITSAKAAGMRAVAITSTNHFSQDLSQADLKISDFQEINLDWVTNLSFD